MAAHPWLQSSLCGGMRTLSPCLLMYSWHYNIKQLWVEWMEFEQNLKPWCCVGWEGNTGWASHWYVYRFPSKFFSTDPKMFNTFFCYVFIYLDIFLYIYSPSFSLLAHWNEDLWLLFSLFKDMESYVKSSLSICCLCMSGHEWGVGSEGSYYYCCVSWG